MERYAETRARGLSEQRLSGIIVKSNSPSCGMERVRVYDGQGVPAKTGVGLFTAQLKKQLPGVPIEEEGRLQDPRLRESFLSKVWSRHRMLQLFQSDWGAGDIVDFHTREKFLLLSHHQEGYREMGRLVAQAGTLDRGTFQKEYETLHARILERGVSRGRHVNVLQHLAGMLRDDLDALALRDMHQAIDAFGQSQMPLIAPITLLRHLAQRTRQDYLLSQTYLTPFPDALAARSHLQ
jgi:uncharacterized protein YbgA (DUF1722 family)